jgi:hypothetical protein
MNNSIYAVHVLGIMPAHQTVPVSADSTWHALNKAMYQFNQPDMKNCLIKYKGSFYRPIDGQLRRVNLQEEIVKKQMVDQVLGKM